MKKILIYLLFLFSLTVSAQIYPGVIASAGVIAGCGSGTTDYGDTGGSSANGSMSTGYIYLMPVDVVGCGTVTQIKIYVSTSSINVKCALYDGASQPTNLVANSETGVVSTASGSYNTWTFAVNPTVLSSTKYWIGVLTSGTLGAKNPGGTVTTYYGNRAYADGFPATIGYSAPMSTVVFSATTDINAYITVQH